MNYTLVASLIFIWCCECNGARILGIYPLPGISHYNLGNALFKELSERGHDVTVISPFHEENPPKNGTYREISLKPLFDEAKKKQKKEWNMFEREGLNPFIGAFYVANMAGKFIGEILNYTEIQKFLHSKEEQFDVVIVDNFLSDAFKAFATHFDAPLIAVSPVWSNFWLNPSIGNPSPPSYIPNILSNYYHPMSFCERMSNTLLDLFNYLLYYYYVFPRHNTYVKEFIPKGGDLYDILYNTTLVLLNSHSSLNQPVPTVPNMIEIGGFHKKPPKKLPKHLEDFVNNAEHGVIYFSMGSNLQGVKFPPEKRQAFIQAFSKLKQKILWKWEDDELPGKPQNVEISKWVPQHDLLAHPNVKLFITHGGFVSSIETAYNGVPVLILPIYGDQMQNAKFAETNGFGTYLTYKDISEENLLNHIKELLENPKFKENAIKRSKIFHDREIPPMEEAVYWVEYVIRHKGAPHLQVTAIQLPWYKYLLIDVLITLLITTLILLYVTKYIFKKLLCKVKKNKKD